MDDAGQASPALRTTNSRQNAGHGGARAAGPQEGLRDKTAEYANGREGAPRSAKPKQDGPHGKQKDSKDVRSKKKGDVDPKVPSKNPKENQAPSRADNKAKDKPKKANDDFNQMSAEEQVLVVRHKLEKIIHGREKDEKKAINLLRVLERTDINKDLVDSTKIDLTLEAMRFVIKDPAIKKKTEKVLRKLKPPQVKKDLREIASTDWRDSKKPEDAGAEDDGLPSMRIGYWMDKLMNGGKNLDALNKQLDNLSKEVKTVVPPTPEKREEAKTPTVDELLAIPEKKTDNALDDLTSGLDNMLLEDKEKENQKKEENKKKETKKEDNLTNEIDKILKEDRKKENKKREDKKRRETEREVCITSEIDKICAKVSGVTLENKEKGDDVKLFAEPEIIIVKKAPDVKEKDGESSLASRIKSSEGTKKLKELAALLDSETTKDEDVIKHLQCLESMVVTFTQLQETKVGISLNGLRKKTDNDEVSSLSKKILRSWKKLVPEAPKKEDMVEKKEQASDAGGSKVDPKAVKTTSEVRAHSRKVLLAALRENESLPERMWVSTVDLAKAIEEAVYAIYLDTNIKYRNQVNSRVYNIKKNMTLQENLLLGNIGPEEVAVMSHDEMASDNLKKIRAELVKKGFAAVVTAHDPDDMFCTCRICLPPFLQA